jgi:hypothetical protein
MQSLPEELTHSISSFLTISEQIITSKTSKYLHSTLKRCKFILDNNTPYNILREFWTAKPYEIRELILDNFDWNIFNLSRPKMLAAEKIIIKRMNIPDLDWLRECSKLKSIEFHDCFLVNQTHKTCLLTLTHDKENDNDENDDINEMDICEQDNESETCLYDELMKHI